MEKSGTFRHEIFMGRKPPGNSSDVGKVISRGEESPGIGLNYTCEKDGSRVASPRSNTSVAW